MCGRFTLRHSQQALAAWLASCSVRLELPDMRPRFNVAPSQMVCTLERSPASGEWKACLRRWGLLPPWAEDLKTGFMMINARAETVASKPSYKPAFRERRCLVLADGFVEWIRDGKNRLPVWFKRVDGNPFAFAGLWEPPPVRLAGSVADGSIPPTGTATIITTHANETVLPVHDRMPVLLSPEDWNSWLTAGDVAVAQSLLRPCPPEMIGGVRISPLINSARNDGPECLETAV